MKNIFIQPEEDDDQFTWHHHYHFYFYFSSHSIWNWKWNFFWIKSSFFFTRLFSVLWVNMPTSFQLTQSQWPDAWAVFNILTKPFFIVNTIKILLNEKHNFVLVNAKCDQTTILFRSVGVLNFLSDSFSVGIWGVLSYWHRYQPAATAINEPVLNYSICNLFCAKKNF